MKIEIKKYFYSKFFFIIFLTFNFINTDKEIDISNEQTYSVNYIDSNIQNNEENKYFFTLKKNAKMKFGISSTYYGDSFHVKIYKRINDNNNIVAENDISINKILFLELTTSEDNPITYYIEYNYKKLHDMVFTLSYIGSNNKEEIYTLSPTKFNNYNYYEYYSLEDFSIFFRVILYSFSTNYKIPIIITGDLVDEKINYFEKNNFEETPNEIINNVAHSSNYLDDKKYIDREKKKLIIYYKKKQSYNILDFKLRVNNIKLGLHYIGVSFVYKETVSNDYGKQFMKNSGLFCFLHLNSISYSSNTTLIVYTNITSILKIYEINSGQESQYIFGQNNNYVKEHIINNNQKISFINVNKDIQNLENYLVFSVEDANDDFMFQFFFIDNNNIIHQKLINRNESINFIRELDHSSYIKDQTYLLINEYQNSSENYIYFNDLIYGDFKYKTINLDTEIYNNVLYDEILYNPHLINSGTEISIFKIPNDIILYGYNEYKIKCNNYNKKLLEKGDFVYICLQESEKTEINMPYPSFGMNGIKYIVSILFYNKIDFPFFVEIYGDFNKLIKNLTNSDYEISDYWNNMLYGNKLIIKNINKIPILLYIKINAEESDFQKLEKSIQEIKIKKSKFYVLLLPKNANSGKIYGVYQELLSLNQINNLCIYHELNNNGILSFPPDPSCNNIINHSNELNITNYGIYSNNENTNFYTYIYYDGDEEVYLNYKHMIISNNKLVYNNINTFVESYDIIYYIINDKQNQDNLLFLQFIKEKKSEFESLYIENQGNNILNTDLYFYNNINIFNSYNNLGKLFSLENNLNIVFKFYELKKSLFYYEFGSSMNYNYNDDESLNAELIKDSKTKYILKFKPFEKEGIANYEVYIFNENSEYTLEILSNPYLIYNLYFINYIKKVTFDNIVSMNDDFSEDTKSKLIIDLENNDIDKFNILLVGIKNNPKTKKFYTPIQISPLKIVLSDFKKTFCFNPDINNENKIKLKLLNDINPKEEGNLIIQWINNDISNNNSKMIIYKGTEEENIIVYSSTNKEYFYLLNTTLVNELFEIVLISNINNINNKICFQYISSSGINDYDESEIEYKYFTSLSLPYFINSKTNLEIFKFKFNQDIINDFNIIVNYYYNSELILNKTYYQGHIKKIGDNFYFGIYSFLKCSNISLKIYLKINNINIDSELESFKIEWIKTNNFIPNNTYNIKIQTVPNFYFVDLNEYKEENKVLLIFTNLNNKKGFNYYKGNYFNNNSKEIQKLLYPFALDEIHDNNFILFITFTENDKNDNGIIDLSILKGTFIINDDCDRPIMYNKIININKSEEVYNICYYSYDTDIKGKLFYSIEPQKENALLLYYLNNFNYDNNPIDNIINNLNKNIIEKDKNNELFGEIEIFKYKYDSNDNIKLKLEFYENSEINKTIYFEEIKNKYFCGKFALSKNKKLILNLRNFSQEKGILIIQWINNSTNDNQELKIYKEKEEESPILYNSSYNEHYYLLNTSLVEDIFEMIYIVNNNNINNKICLQYISPLGETDIEYKYITSLNLPYYTNRNETKTNNEILELEYKRNLINNLNFSLYYLIDGIYKLERNYSQNDLKKIGDDNIYLGLNPNYSKSYFNIQLFIKNKIDFSNEESFIIKKKELNYLPFEYQNIIINKQPQYYYMNLTEILNTDEALLFYSNLLNKGLTVYRNNFFLSNNNNIETMDKSFNIFNSKDIFTFILYSNLENKGYIDFFIFDNNTTLIFEENCDIENIFNKEYSLIKDKLYIICYNKNKKNNKYYLSYNIENINNNKINAYYSNEILSKNSISEIWNALSSNRLNPDENKIIEDDFEISILKCEYEKRNEETYSNITFILTKYTEKEEVKSFKSNDHGGLISAFLFLGAILILITIFWYKNSKKKIHISLDTSSNNSALSTENDKDSKKVSFL